jgi:hypothetical protein
MSPGRGRVNKDRTGQNRRLCVRIIVGRVVVEFQKCSWPAEIGTLSMPDAHSNQADGTGIETLWIPRPGCAQLYA